MKRRPAFWAVAIRISVLRWARDDRYSTVTFFERGASDRGANSQRWQIVHGS
jgi:hypothetical protein